MLMEGTILMEKQDIAERWKSFRTSVWWEYTKTIKGQTLYTGRGIKMPIGSTKSDSPGSGAE